MHCIGLSINPVEPTLDFKCKNTHLDILQRLCKYKTDKNYLTVLNVWKLLLYKLLLQFEYTVHIIYVQSVYLKNSSTHTRNISQSRSKYLKPLTNGQLQKQMLYF